MRRFWSAVGFLTTLPVPIHDLRPDASKRAAIWFPFVGLLIGGMLAVGSLLFMWLFPSLVAAILVVALWAALTGALHLDGLADCGDGLLPPVSRERRLEIMRDPRVGAFGVTSLLLVLLLKTGSLATLPSMWPALLVAPIWARWLILVAARRPSARSDGMGASMQFALTTHQLALTALLPVGMTAVIGLWYWPLWPAAVAAVLAALSFLHLADRRIGGVTGDVFGAVVEISETVFLCVACIRVTLG